MDSGQENKHTEKRGLVAIARGKDKENRKRRKPVRCRDSTGLWTERRSNSVPCAARRPHPTKALTGNKALQGQPAFNRETWKQFVQDAHSWV